MTPGPTGFGVVLSYVCQLCKCCACKECIYKYIYGLTFVGMRKIG